MSVDSQRGAGTTFIIRLPLTLSITQALMVHVGDQLFAVPLAAVVNIVEYPIEKLNNIAVGKNPLLNYRDQVYPYMHLGTRLGLAAGRQREHKVPILLVRTRHARSRDPGGRPARHARSGDQGAGSAACRAQGLCPAPPSSATAAWC